MLLQHTDCVVPPNSHTSIWLVIVAVSSEDYLAGRLRRPSQQPFSMSAVFIPSPM